MSFSAKHLLHWRQNSKRDKMKKKIEDLSNEWDQLTQYVILLEQNAFQESSYYDKTYNDLQAKLTQLAYFNNYFEDIKNIMTEMLSSKDIKPKEFQSVSGEMFEVICELNRVQKETTSMQKEFDITFSDREEKIQKQQETITDIKSRISQIEAELSTLRLSS
jgi:predicted nuclease with TOPRIM domain